MSLIYRLGVERSLPLRFSVAELQREISVIKALARGFLDLEADAVLSSASSALTQICKRRDGHSVGWQISESWPIRTNASHGQYQPQQLNSNVVHAELSFVWQIAPVVPVQQKAPARFVDLVGTASTRITVREGPPEARGTELAMWRMEIGDNLSPGVHFHTQVMGRKGDLVFPHHVDIPRLPSVTVSPFACVEYILAELFQDDWAAHASRDFEHGREWNGIQSVRLKRQLEWHLEAIESSTGSPWAAWKRAKPPLELFSR
jgi:hypothetical protein